jgi:hypothetical protein
VEASEHRDFAFKHIEALDRCAGVKKALSGNRVAFVRAFINLAATCDTRTNV